MSDKRLLIKSLIIGTLCGVLAQIILLCVAAAAMLCTGKLPGGALDYIMLAVCAIGALAGGFISAKLNRGAGLIVGLISGLALFFILTVAAMIKSDSSFSLLSLIRLAAMLFGGAAGGILGVREKTKISI